MRLPWLLLVVFLNACGAGSARQVGEPTAVEVPVDVARAIEGVMEQYRQAHEVHSAEGLEALYQTGLDVVLVHQGVVHQGWSQVRAALALRVQDATKVRMVIKNLSIQTLGQDSALATAGLEINIGDEATTTTERGVVTLAFRKVGEDWKVVAEHFSFPTGPQ